jgi:glutamine amidotransferase PdxT
MPTIDKSHRASLTLGVLALQGAFQEHINALHCVCHATTSPDPTITILAVRTPFQLWQVDGLILPGGESTTMTRLMREPVVGTEGTITTMEAELKTFASMRPVWVG